ELLDWTDDLQVEMLAQTRIDDDDGTFAALHVEAAEIAGDLVERSLRRGQADAGEWAWVDRLQTLQQKRQKDAAFVWAQRVDLVHDAMRDVPQRLAGLRRQQQVQRFGRRDQHVRGLASQALAFGGRGVARADGDLDRRQHEPG